MPKENVILHTGVKGMRWGVRRDQRANTYIKVGSGKGTTSEKIRSYGDLGPVDLIKGGGLQGGSLRKGTRIKRSTANIRSGNAGVRDILTRAANIRYQDMIPTAKSPNDTSGSPGASMAGVILAQAGRAALL